MYVLTHRCSLSIFKLDFCNPKRQKALKAWQLHSQIRARYVFSTLENSPLAASSKDTVPPMEVMALCDFVDATNAGTLPHKRPDGAIRRDLAAVGGGHITLERSISITHTVRDRGTNLSHKQNKG